MHRMMNNTMPIFMFIYETLVILWNVLQTIINGIRNYTPIVYNFMWNFTEALYDKSYETTPPDSPKTPLIDKTWCNIDPNNIIENEDKKRM